MNNIVFRIFKKNIKVSILALVLIATTIFASYYLKPQLPDKQYLTLQEARTIALEDIPSYYRVDYHAEYIEDKYIYVFEAFTTSETYTISVDGQSGEIISTIKTSN